MTGVLLTVLLSVLTVLHCVPPRSREQCRLHPHWLDVWIEATDGAQISIVDNNIGSYGQCVLKLEKSQKVESFILRNNRNNCFHCVFVEELHANILRYRVSQCQQHRDISKLCSNAQTNPWRFLYRETPQPSRCPGVLSGSHQISQYSEYDSASSQYIDNCGEPRSEINSCHRRDRDDPQITINLGKCPSGTLYHRTSLTQSLQCLGSWQAGGTLFLVTAGSVWEYWEPGEYRNTDMKFTCLALTTDGLNIYMAEGFGSGCDGLGLALTPYNGMRKFVLQKRMRLEQSCQFPAWLTGSTWQMISKGGTITQDRTEPSLISFNTTSSFLMIFNQEEFAQEFSCSKKLLDSETEVRIQLFSQAKCLGSYHCLHAQRSPHSSTVNLHLGGPTPHLEHSCVPPAMDEEFPFLKSALIPSQSNVSSPGMKIVRRYNPALTSTEVSVNTERENKLNLETAERNILAKITHFNNQFIQHVSQEVRLLLRRIKQNSPSQLTEL